MAAFGVLIACGWMWPAAIYDPNDMRAVGVAAIVAYVMVHHLVALLPAEGDEGRGGNA
jgi:hypothetical protein